MTNPTTPKKLIEVAMPVKEVSAESVRDKSIRHGHISTLHLWWARRPLPVCRAVVFASLVPDPLDQDCPPAFGEAIDQLLGIQDDGLDPYRPYEDIPYTAVADAMEDNRRNRLLMFIGKFSKIFVSREKQGKKVAAADMLSDYSLIKWNNKNNERIINRARKLIWVAHNAAKQPEATYAQLAREFDQHHRAIQEAERALYDTVDRHQVSEAVTHRENALQQAIDAFLNRMPRVFDPFAGGGAIPLEAARLGCRSYGNDLNPVAHIIQKGSLEFPQRYGKPVVYSEAAFVARYGEAALKEWQNDQGLQFINTQGKVYLENRLSYDVAFYAKKLLQLAEAEVGHLYPADKDGNKPIAYYWARVATCANPSCRAEVPLLKQFYLVNKGNKKVYLSPKIKDKKVTFGLKRGDCVQEGFVLSRKSMKCPVCGNVTANKELKQQFLAGNYKTELLAIIEESKEGKKYRLPTDDERDIILGEVDVDQSQIPQEKLPVENTRQFDLCPWGFIKYGDMFSPRQLLTMQTLVDKLKLIKKELGVGDETHITDEYARAVVTYLGILLDKIAVSNTSFGRWHVGRETLEHPFSRQAIAMTFDFPESNPFCDSTGSAINQINWITKYNVSYSTFPGILQDQAALSNRFLSSKAMIRG